MKTCRRCSWPLTLSASRGDTHIACLRACRYCDEELTAKDDPDACRRCADGPSDDEIYGSDFRMPSPMENYEERENL